MERRSSRTPRACWKTGYLQVGVHNVTVYRGPRAYPAPSPQGRRGNNTQDGDRSATNRWVLVPGLLGERAGPAGLAVTPGEEFRNAGEHPGRDWDGRAAPYDRAPDQYAGTSLRLQVLEVISSLLNSTGPELEEVRFRLQNLVREHPWDPEIALLLHLSGMGRDTAAPQPPTTPTTQPPAVPTNAVQANTAPANALAPEPLLGECPE